MTTGVVLLNFGEPVEPTHESVMDYLERIFIANADLEDATTPGAARERSRELAERRAPALLAEYEELGGSPLNSQAAAQADALEATLRDRDYDVRTYLGMQFTKPFIRTAAKRAKSDGVDHLVGLPVYPLCGHSTTVAALAELTTAVADLDWGVEYDEITGWHRYPLYNRLRADNIAAFAEDHGVPVTAPETELFFSAHGTPTHYLDGGNRYDRYVEEWCEVMASMLGVTDFTLGFQNHDTRDVSWTEPDVDDAIRSVEAERVVVEPISFMHEQSETLSELDEDLRATAESVGLEFYRVPVPHDDPRFATVLADLVEPFVGEFDPGYYQFRPCLCKDTSGTVCLNGRRPPAHDTGENH